ncbi:phospholipase [Pyruvatibacter mobilis]|jgi:phospholipase/carboxylesterase|uniref:Phospholipase n=1 Tax=Pyruvatibacter mobilis TaxID=1712261 RepID=A0A845Q8B0_9HYPH|nr:dienelactone hydrolase family protein [Pyruvatibacter mobilis]NBG94470.1 phospholipase [Pyruvatibacter mobilis]QJD73994.1 phospholipase [Pyruvatibacter mobilis]GGD03216.1 phospholipase [Pyruvatibacter mobilis]
MSSELDGPRLAPANGGPADRLVVLVHGYGADGNDLIALGNHWRTLMPSAAFVAPNGPQRCDGNPMGYQWFPITRLDPVELLKGVESAAPLLDAFIDQELEANGLDGSRLALVGFSQGTMMSLHVGTRRVPGPVGILGYSGALVAPEKLADVPSRPPVMLIHGDADDMLPVQAMHAAAGALGDADFAVRWHVARGVGHGIDPEGLELGGRFIADCFA